MSKMNLSRLAQICAAAEMNHMATGLPGVPTVAIGVTGDHIGKMAVHILTGSPNIKGANLSGVPLKYIAELNKTIVVLKCMEIRQFYKNLGWTFEDFLHKDRKHLH
jgi:hypothetical protein